MRNGLSSLKPLSAVPCLQALVFAGAYTRRRARHDEGSNAIFELGEV